MAGKAWLAMAVACAAASARADDELAARLSRVLGARVEPPSEVRGHFRPAPRTDDPSPLPAPAPGRPDPRTAYQAQVYAAQGLTIEQITFTDPAVALQYADRILSPLEREYQDQAVVEVRGPHVVAIYAPADRRGPPVRDLARELMPEVWSSSTASWEPRAYLGLRDARGMAIDTVRRGPLQDELQRMLDQARTTFPGASSTDGRFRWTHPERTAFTLLTVDGTRVTVDASRSPARVVQGDDAGTRSLADDLEGLKQVLPARDEPGSTPPPSGVGLKKTLGAMEEAMGR